MFTTITPNPFFAFDTFFDGIEEVDDDDDSKLCVPNGPIQFIDSYLSDAPWLGGRAQLNTSNGSSPLLQDPKKKKKKKQPRNKRFGRRVWSLDPPLWLFNSSHACYHSRKRCMHCLAWDTPMWRAGPAGAGTLCNACGLRFNSGRLLPEYRPAASPDFAAVGTYSNRHKNVMRIREIKSSVFNK